jgi:hypothetical protein
MVAFRLRDGTVDRNGVEVGYIEPLVPVELRVRQTIRFQAAVFRTEVDDGII